MDRKTNNEILPFSADIAPAAPIIPTKVGNFRAVLNLLTGKSSPKPSPFVRTPEVKPVPEGKERLSGSFYYETNGDEILVSPAAKEALMEKPGMYIGRVKLTFDKTKEEITLLLPWNMGDEATDALENALPISDRAECSWWRFAATTMPSKSGEFTLDLEVRDGQVVLPDCVDPYLEDVRKI